MGKLVFTKDVHDSIEAMGEWAIEGEAKSVFGVLRHEPTKLANLKIFGTVNTEAPRTIVGKREGGHCITVFDAVGLHPYGNLLSPETSVTEYGFSSFWEGPQCFDKKSEVRFRQATFGINGLDGWYSPPAFDCSNEGKSRTKIRVEYKRPKTIKIYEDENVRIKVGYAVETSGVSIAQCRMEVAQVPRVIVRAKRGKIPFYDGFKSLESYIRFAHNFLALLIGKDALIYDLMCTSEYLRFRRSNNSKNPVRLVHGEKTFKYRWSRSLPVEVKSDPLSIVIPLSKNLDICNASKQFAEVFFSDRELFESIVAYTYSWRTFTDNTLPEQVFLFEGLCKRLLLRECREEKVNRLENSGDLKTIQQIEQLPVIMADKDMREMVKRLRHPDPSLKDMLTVAFASTSDVFEFLRNEELAKNLKEYLGKRRNGTAHSSKKCDSSVDQDAWCSRFLQMESLLLILLHCGFSIENLKAYFRRPFTGYSYLEKYLPKVMSKSK